jgi:hypothetical protein
MVVAVSLLCWLCMRVGYGSHSGVSMAQAATHGAPAVGRLNLGCERNVGEDQQSRSVKYTMSLSLIHTITAKT